MIRDKQRPSNYETNRLLAEANIPLTSAGAARTHTLTSTQLRSVEMAPSMFPLHIVDVWTNSTGRNEWYA